MLTGGGIMVQRLGDLLQGRRTDVSAPEKIHHHPHPDHRGARAICPLCCRHRHLTSIIEAMRAFDHLAPGLYSKNTLLYGVEVKFYSSKITVDDKL